MKKHGILLAVFLIFGIQAFADENAKVPENMGFRWHTDNFRAANPAISFVYLNALFFNVDNEHFFKNFGEAPAKSINTRHEQRRYENAQNNYDLPGFLLTITGYSLLWIYADKNPMCIHI
jgi:hypothetical protein